MKKAFFLAFLVALAPAVMAQNPPFGLTPAESKKAETYFHFSLARVLDQQEDWDESIKEYRKALDLAPNDSGIYAAMARTYLNQRNRDEAIRAAQRAIEIDADNLGAHKLLSDIYINQLSSANGQSIPKDLLDKTIHEFEEIVRIDPKGHEGYVMLGELYRVSGSPDKSMEVYRKLLGVEPGSESAIMALAQLALDADRNAEAIEILKNLLKDQPNSYKAIEMLGDAQTALGNSTAAAESYKRAAAMNDDPDLRDKLAKALYDDNQFEEAAKAFEQILKEDPGNAQVLQWLGQIYRRQMKYAQAREILGKALGRNDVANIGVRVELALVDRDEGKFDESIKGFELLLKDTEKSSYNPAEKQRRAFFYTQIGVINSLLTHFDAAIAAFTNVRGLSDFSDRSRVDLMIADTYKEAKNPDKALATIQAALQDSPNNKSLLMGYADLLAERQRFEEGLQILQKLAGNKEPDVDVLRAMTSIYERSEKFAEAQKLLDSAAKRFPDDLEVYFLQGALYERQKNFPLAEQSFRKALDLDKDNPSVLNYLGYMLADRGNNLDEALAMIKKAVDSDPINGAFLDSLGWVYFKRNELDLAERFLKRAVAFAATNATMHDHLGDLYYKTARYQEAVASWTKGLQYADEPNEAAQIRQKLEQAKSRPPSQ